jgi:hypothetical protein
MLPTADKGDWSDLARTAIALQGIACHHGMKPRLGVRSIDRCLAAAVRHLAWSVRRSAADDELGKEHHKDQAILHVILAFAADDHIPSYKNAFRKAAETERFLPLRAMTCLAEALSYSLERSIENAFLYATEGVANLILDRPDDFQNRIAALIAEKTSDAPRRLRASAFSAAF